jgi:hypothetical protein
MINCGTARAGYDFRRSGGAAGKIYCVGTETPPSILFLNNIRRSPILIGYEYVSVAAYQLDGGHEITFIFE